jgi:polyhydroxyalkanoate synthesis regulator phasin
MSILEDFLKKVTHLGFGVVAVSRDKIEQKVREWTESENLNPSESRRLVDRLVEQGEQERIELQRVVQDQVKKSLVRFGIFREDKDENQVETLQEEIQGLRGRIVELEKRLEDKLDNEDQLDEKIEKSRPVQPYPPDQSAQLAQPEEVNRSVE